MDDEFPWDDLLDCIEGGKLVPIVGDELIRADYQGRVVSLQRLLAERLAEREHLTVQLTPHFELNDAVGAYLEKPQAKLAGMCDRIAGLSRSLIPPYPVPQGLQRLAEVSAIQLFMSVTFDSLLARAIDQARYNGEHVTREIEFSINQSTARQNDALNVQPGSGPIVFNLFGRAQGKSEFAIHDEDKLEFIHKLVSGDVAPPGWLLSDLRSKDLLILGVHLPDWLARFVLRAATRDRLRLASRTCYVAQERESSAMLSDFLRRFGRETRIEVFQGNAHDFVDELNRRWRERHPHTDEPLPASSRSEAPRRNTFISYGRETLPEVERLHAVIKGLGGEPWFDRSELSAGDQWEQRILPQIQREARLFVPVISRRTALRGEGYVFREWREALERSKKIVGRKFVMPVVVDAEYQGNLEQYQSLVDEFPALRELHFGRAPGGEPDPVLRQALVTEIRAMNRAPAS
jgi:hypothetical protein